MSSSAVRSEPGSFLDEFSECSANVVEELEEADAQRILAEMTAGGAREIRVLMAYPPDTAGGPMTPAFVAVPADVGVLSERSADSGVQRIIGRGRMYG